MYLNRRPYQENHIPNKLKYNNIIKKTPFHYNKPNTIDFYHKNQPTEDYDDTFLELMESPNFSLINQTHKKESFEEKIEKLEQQPTEIFKPIPYYEDDLYIISNYLYHGIRFQNHLEKLESIFESKAILAGNYQETYYYYNYYDNCNNGEYISLASIEEDYDLVYKTFIMENISLVISQECNAIKTIYLPYEEWEKISNIETKNRYSYINNEYQVKKEIPLSLVKAIGLPAKYFRLINKEHLIDTYLNDILDLMKKYNINLPIVDTSYYNKPLYLPETYISKRLIKRSHS